MATLRSIFMLLACILVAGCFSQTNDENNSKSADSNSTWTTIGYGGGGAMFYPQVSPFNPSYAFVACDMTSNFVTYNGGESWRMFNLHDPVKYFVFDPLDSNVVYAKSIGLFKSTDQGKTWNLFYPSPAEIKAVVSKGDHAHERLVTTDSTLREVQAFAIHPGDSKKMYAAIAIDRNVGLFTSVDGGASWKKEQQLTLNAKNIFLHPSTDGKEPVIIVTSDQGVTVINNRKSTFNKAPDKVNLLTHFTGGFDKQTGKYIVYAIAGKSYFDPKGTKSGIFFTDNFGKTWQNREEGIAGLSMKGTPVAEYRTVATSALNPSTVYISYNDLQANDDTTYLGVAKSTDFGKTWTLVWKDIETKSGQVVSANFTSGWINDRFGPRWGENPFSIGVSSTDPNVCYATDFGRTVKTMDGGKTWHQVYTTKKEGGGWVSRGLEVTTGYQIVADPFDKNNVFICNTDIGLMKSSDGGKSWSSTTHKNGVPRSWENSTYWLAFDPSIKNKVWAAMTGVHDLPRPKMFRNRSVKTYKGGVVLSEDGGKTWKTTSEGIGEGAVVHLLLDEISNKDSRTLYACVFGKGVYKSVDGGKTWSQKNNGIKGDEPFAWRISRREKDGALFLVVCRRSDDGSIGNAGDGAIYRSDDGAETWKEITMPEGTNGPMHIVIDDENDSRLLLSAWGRTTEGKFSPDENGGIYVSDNDGNSWKNVMQHDQHIHDITYDKRNKTYYACGFNGSAYRSGDRGNTWTRIKGYNFKWGKRVDPDPNDPNMVYIITFGGGVWYGPAKGDNSATEDIVTPVLKY